MNRFFRICFLCVAGVVVFCLGMWFSSYLSVKDTINPPSEPEKSEEICEIASEDPVISVEATVIPTVDMNTEYIIVKENIITGEITTVHEDLPAQFVGMTRKEIEDYWSVYAMSPVLDDREDGFVNAMVDSYSAEQLIIKKVYEPLYLEECFYLRAEENYVVVYYGDNLTVYMYTGIRMDMLPENTRTEIENCKKIDSQESLYSFLESYTS